MSVWVVCPASFCMILKIVPRTPFPEKNHIFCCLYTTSEGTRVKSWLIKSVGDASSDKVQSFKVNLSVEIFWCCWELLHSTVIIVVHKFDISVLPICISSGDI